MIACRQPAYTFEAFGARRRFWTDPLTAFHSDTRKFHSTNTGTSWS